MAEKTKKSKALNKKNILYAVWVVALVAVMVTAIVVIASVSSRRAGNLIEAPDTAPVASGGDTASDPAGGEEEPDPDDGHDPGGTQPTEQPVATRISFIMPCAAGSIVKRFTEDTVVFNSTLGAYMGHMGVDIAAEAGAEVYCVYDGIVESVTTSYLNGTTVTVDHGNGLKSVYNSIDADEALYEGARVAQGDVLGTVAANNLQEYKDGAHLHFEVVKSGAKIDPEDYLIGEEK